ncbi:fluoride efflux transporter CrcB [Hyphobacterium marinum]|uniref:Fluoride-specific ion channel FluC n=1 Tax=Hyphobacterium marinum TaxID=3116574 RepID=A0ABU7LZB6_9PROT|nr:fluoride efflux transporter CrcB [Hyphobacterium sp. Y6023]MEE2566909.1 fluoride efflux transporter CrcB [Hyphobacterium sp. Y6023]
MTNLLLIAAGGAIGAVSRHLTGQWALRALGPEWPHGTFLVNVIGGLMMGGFIGWLSQAGRADANALRAFFAVGILGGFTTFSAFSLDVVVMIERKQWFNALGYTLGSVVLAVLALFVGLLIARRVFA